MENKSTGLHGFSSQSRKRSSSHYLEGRRLLLLSGGTWKDDIKKHANEEGIVLLATGNDDSSGIFEIADEVFHVDSTDADAMSELIRRAHVDGVYLGSCEPVIRAASEYVSSSGLPCYCTRSQWDALQDKAQFKELLISCDLPPVPSYDASSADAAVDSVSSDGYPVVVKPVDGAGSRGVVVCHTPDELRCGFALACEVSNSGHAVVEKFVRNDSVIAFFTFIDGLPVLSCLQDNYPVLYKEQGSYVGALRVCPSPLTDEFRRRFESKLATMFSKIGIDKGNLWIEVFHDGNDWYFNEVGYRIDGYFSMYAVNYLTGVNQLAMDMDLALTGKASPDSGSSLIPPSVPRKSHYCMYPVQMKPGVIAKIDGLGDLLQIPEVVAVPLTKRVGQKVVPSGSVDQVCMIVHFVCDTAAELEAMLDTIHTTLSVTDREGNELLVRMLSTEAAQRRLTSFN